jgi:site-specific recombinase XerD
MIFYDKLSKDFKIEKYVAVSHRSLTQKEVDIILNKLEGKTLLQNIIIIFINTGVRRSELEELITKYKENSNTNVIDIIGKGDKKRGVFLNKEAKEALDKIKGMEFKINSQATIL